MVSGELVVNFAAAHLALKVLCGMSFLRAADIFALYSIKSGVFHPKSVFDLLSDLILKYNYNFIIDNPFIK